MKKTKSEQLVLKGTDEGEILARLSERVEKAITTIQELRQERDALRSKLEELQRKFVGRETESGELDDLRSEHDRMKSERGEIRNRIESILGNLESLDDEE